MVRSSITGKIKGIYNRRKCHEHENFPKSERKSLQRSLPAMLLDRQPLG